MAMEIEMKMKMSDDDGDEGEGNETCAGRCLELRRCSIPSLRHRPLPPTSGNQIWGLVIPTQLRFLIYGIFFTACFIRLDSVQPCNMLPQSLRCVHAKPLRVIGSLTNELEAYTSKRKIGLLRLVRLILTTRSFFKVSGIATIAKPGTRNSALL